jgi:SAM-dependent methyltransferase
MSERVGFAGHVVATDINTDWLPASLPANVDVRRHDIGVDPLAEGTFNLVHARAVLSFVPGRKTALEGMITALKPGGWLLVEELVHPVTEPPATDGSGSELANKSRRAIEEVIRRRGADPAFGRNLPAVILAADLVDVGAEGYFVPFCTDAVAGLARAKYRPDRCRDGRNRLDELGGTGPLPRDS